MALAVIQVACRKEISIPGDLGIIGFDNIPESEFFCPSLTTIQQDQYGVGKVAVEETIKRIELGWQGQEATPDSTLLAPTLVVRQSSLRPPKK